MAESKEFGEIEEGDYIMLKDHPCRVVEIQEDTHEIQGQGVLDSEFRTDSFDGADAPVEMVDVEYEDCEVESVDTGSNTVTLTDGTQIPAMDESVATQLYQEIVDKEDRGEDAKVTARVVSARGERVVLWA
ncbi:MAG: hypothetical protein GOMPHAMPRED_004483 [Gomphillus americanus]|uniref:Uncharacterized protein n=1 Tax=Gomphillus americanus TaxID=1940652 RepID=A0A8H3FU09_9LECA|nr:MAG: hypothetical protein GOMPHAMPRED_004483 [Gomphillus americanus]